MIAGARPHGPQCEPAKDCPLCPRLVRYRAQNSAAEPSWFNGPAPSFGDEEARLLIVGLAPGRTGANRTGRPFTGDFAGDLLYGTLLRLGIAQGRYEARPDDGLVLRGAMITNAVRCAPPENKPDRDEIRTCRDFLKARIAALPRLKALFTLGKIAHDSTLLALGAKPSDLPFGHGVQGRIGAYQVQASYHCSRYNTQTRRLTAPMFEEALTAAWRAAN